MQGKTLRAMLCTAKQTIRWLLRMIAKKGGHLLQTLFFRLLHQNGLALTGGTNSKGNSDVWQ
jgi:hypothetical protein